jgi:hypothetical protein
MKKKACIVDIKKKFRKKYLRQPSIDFDFCKNRHPTLFLLSFFLGESKPPFCLHYEKSSPLNIVYRKIN